MAALRGELREAVAAMRASADADVAEAARRATAIPAAARVGRILELAQATLADRR
jgi:hypothetical protein